MEQQERNGTMALSWQWDNKYAEATYKVIGDGGWREATYNWYAGNAPMVETWEPGDDTYTVTSFWLDDQHMKNMLGLSKDHKENCYAHKERRLVKLSVTKAKCPNFKKLMAAISAADFPEGITIEII